MICLAQGWLFCHCASGCVAHKGIGMPFGQSPVHGLWQRKLQAGQQQQALTRAPILHKRADSRIMLLLAKQPVYTMSGV